MQQQNIPVPTSLAHAHPFVASTREAALGWICTPDGRLSPRPEPGIAEVRVSRAQLDRALRIVQAVITASEARGMDVAAVGSTRSHRAGVGIGRSGCLTAIRVEERRHLGAFSDLDLEQWRLEAPEWLASREPELRERGWLPRANGKLRVLLPRRNDPRPAVRCPLRALLLTSPSFSEGRAPRQRCPRSYATAPEHRAMFTGSIIGGAGAGAL